VVVDRDKSRRGCPASWRLADADDFPPSISRQTPLAGNQHPSDQGEHPPIPGFPPTLAVGGKLQTNGIHTDPTGA
jgi:hypothetical protein